MKKTNFTLKKENLEKLKRYAKELGTTASNVLSIIIQGKTQLYELEWLERSKLVRTCLFSEKHNLNVESINFYIENCNIEEISHKVIPNFKISKTSKNPESQKKKIQRMKKFEHGIGKFFL